MHVHVMMIFTGKEFGVDPLKDLGFVGALTFLFFIGFANRLLI